MYAPVQSVLPNMSHYLFLGSIKPDLNQTIFDTDISEIYILGDSKIFGGFGSYTLVLILYSVRKFWGKVSLERIGVLEECTGRS